MAWIKRNLIFVIIAAVGVLATGYCAYLLYAAMADDAKISDDYTQNLNSLNDLRKKRPYPDQATIRAAQEDQQRVKSFLGEFGKAFASFPAPPPEDARGFKDYLQQTIYQWGMDATNVNVLLPPNYLFSWSEQKERLNYPTECIGPWMEQLEEEKAIIRILFAAHINYLDYIKRVPTSCDEVAGSDYLAATPVVASWGTVTPYSLAFRGFSAELAAVLAGFAHSSNCFIVKDVTVSQSKGDYTQTFSTQQPNSPAPAITYYQAPSSDSRRFGRPGMPMFQRPQQSIPATGVAISAASAPPVTVLTEEPLYVTMAIDVVKLK